MQRVNRELVSFQCVFASLVTEEMGGSVQVNCLHSLMWSSWLPNVCFLRCSSEVLFPLQILMSAREETRIVTKKLSVSTPWDPTAALANWDLKAMGLTANVRWRIE